MWRRIGLAWVHNEELGALRNHWETDLNSISQLIFQLAKLSKEKEMPLETVNSQSWRCVRLNYSDSPVRLGMARGLEWQTWTWVVVDHNEKMVWVQIANPKGAQHSQSGWELGRAFGIVGVQRVIWSDSWIWGKERKVGVMVRLTGLSILGTVGPWVLKGQAALR